MINLKADLWFSKNFSDKITKEFITWWCSVYGRPEDYVEEEDEQHEYWVRCAFAWHGWTAAKSA